MAQNFTSIDDLIKKNSQPVSKPKEGEPSRGKTEAYNLEEVVEHEINDEEVKGHVTTRHESIKLPPDLKKMGLKSVSTTSFPSYQNVKTPLADDKVMTGLHAPITSSLRWLATLALYVLRQAHLTLKEIHGKVVRVVKN